MESKGTLVDMLDRASEVKTFDEMKMGVKGLVEAGMTKIPRIFHNPLASVTTPKPPSTVRIPTIDLRGGVFDSEVTRQSVVAKVKEAMEKFGFFFRQLTMGFHSMSWRKWKLGFVGFTGKIQKRGKCSTAETKLKRSSITVMLISMTLRLRVGEIP
ncbi:unnamed protein product [Brassica napus]|uniref:(rape) hypothetical protein n=1 Tax=Brassica napus TaxID=3708 RepID=A0A816VCF3_BRANA|nr:unnamed protein product [Brassica napus]